MKKIACVAVTLILFFGSNAQDILTKKSTEAAFDITKSTAIYVDSSEDAGVKRVALLLQQDIELVTNVKLAIIGSLNKPYQNIILIGTLNKSALLKEVINAQLIDAKYLIDKWEAFEIKSIGEPFDLVKNIMVIAGSDRRGAMYGVAELSKQIGVSPWYWWADVPVEKQNTLLVKKNAFFQDAPAVKYRGIFLNDEAPALSGWCKEKFGGFNHKFYEKVFELMVRLKSNYIWPAMWGNAFYDDDSLNIQMADEYAIVIGTSHHEPLMRAHDEWRRYGKGKWNYDSNETRLKSFWTEGIQRIRNTDKIVSIGMRGDGDEPMSQGTAISLLERIVGDQRKIIAGVTKKDATQTPQLWALYKEVQEYYDKGMRVPDDVTLLLCDDNWGNIRKLPKLTDKPRSGGYGIYYHYDYVGGPRNYKWINTNNIARVWEQMHLAYEYNVDKIWIVNVGDLKPMEFPISFFLDYAWKPSKWNAENLVTYYTQWAAQQFGKKHAAAIGELVKKYGQISARRKPELVSAETYSLNYKEADKIVREYNELLNKARSINALLPINYRDAFYQLVLHPIQANGNLHEMYVAAAWNKYYTDAESLSANFYANKVRQLYRQDSLIANYYNDTLADGKWRHMMDQTHIGYTYWQQPEANSMPSISYIVTEGDVVLEGNEPVLFSDEAKNATTDFFKERDGYVSMEASHFTKAMGNSFINWKVIPDIGRTGDGVTSFPVTINIDTVTANTPHLEYDFTTTTKGNITVQAYFSPTLDFHDKGGLRCAISIDNDAPQIVNLHENWNNRAWDKAVADNIILNSLKASLSVAGKHTLKYWMLDGGVVLQKLVIDLDGLKESYLGPEETLTPVPSP